MQKYVRKLIVPLILLFVLWGFLGITTEISTIVYQIDIFSVIAAAVFYILSIILWLFGWAYLINKQNKTPFRSLVLSGFSSVYGSFTPLQIGTEYLRAINNKNFLGVRYSETLSASMVARGSKFLLLGLGAVIVFITLFQTANELFLWVYTAGMGIVLLLAVIFLLPLYPKLGRKFSKLIEKFLPKNSITSHVTNYFYNYSSYLGKVKPAGIFLVLILTVVQLYFELLAIDFSLRAFGVILPFAALFSFLVIVSILQRVPFLPMGVGLVELAGLYFLSVPELTLGTVIDNVTIAGTLIVYGFARILIPVLLSLIVSFFASRYFQGNSPNPSSVPLKQK